MGKVSIRPMKESDLTFIHEGLSETNWQDIPSDQREVVTREEADKKVSDDFARFRREKRFKFKVFVATSEDVRPVGYVSVGELMNPTVGIRLGSVLDFWVSERFRSQGIGSALLDYALSYIKKQGYSHASIMVSTSNQRALQMYAKRGFVPDRIHLVKRIRDADD